MLILGIESSCDETGVALVEVDLANRDAPPVLLADELHSQIKMHQPYGGVVPELASRDHIRRVLPLLQATLDKACRPLSDVDVVVFVLREIRPNKIGEFFARNHARAVIIRATPAKGVNLNVRIESVSESLRHELGSSYY